METLIYTVTFSGNTLRRVNERVGSLLESGQELTRKRAVEKLIPDNNGKEFYQRALDTINQLFIADIPLKDVARVTIGTDPQIPRKNLRYEIELTIPSDKVDSPGINADLAYVMPYPRNADGEERLVTKRIEESFFDALDDGCLLEIRDGYDGVALFQRHSQIGEEDYYIRVDIHNSKMSPSDVDPLGAELYPGFRALLKEIYGGLKPIDMQSDVLMIPHEFDPKHDILKVNI